MKKWTEAFSEIPSEKRIKIISSLYDEFNGNFNKIKIEIEKQINQALGEKEIKDDSADEEEAPRKRKRKRKKRRNQSSGFGNFDRIDVDDEGNPIFHDNDDEERIEGDEDEDENEDEDETVGKIENFISDQEDQGIFIVWNKKDKKLEYSRDGSPLHANKVKALEKKMTMDGSGFTVDDLVDYLKRGKYKNETFNQLLNKFKSLIKS